MNQKRPVEEGGAPLQRFLRKQAVLEITGLKQSTMYAMIQRGEFPASYAASAKVPVWLESEVRDWQEKVIAARLQVPPPARSGAEAA